MIMTAKRGYKSILLCTSLLLISACSGPWPGSSAKEKNVPVLSQDERKRAMDKLDPAITQAQNKFGLQLYHELAQSAESGENIILSPYSIFTALVLAYNGSSGETSKEMAHTLGLESLSKEQVNASGRTLQTLLEDAGSGVRLNTANSIWYRSSLEIKNMFMQMAQNSYHADIQAVDFQKEKTLKEINGWVNKHTNGKIPSILDQVPDPSTLAILLNAVYFNGAWQSPFNPENTREGSFTRPDGSVQKVPMMMQGGMFEYKQTPKAQAIRLPYGDGRLNMLIILPAKGQSLDTLMEQILQDPSPWQARFDHASGEFQLPRFKAEYTGQLEKSLMKMGMKQVFDPAAADFTDMSDAKPLFISSILHKTVLDVNEKGTEAAAVTEIGMAGSAPPKERFQMIVDHPFFFCIEDSLTGLWLFLGTVVDPS